MKRYASILASLLLGATASAAPAEAFDWPQWQGPDRNAVSRERGLLQEWPKDGPPLAWKVNGLGGGYSAPSVAGGRIFGMSNRGDYQVVWALSEADRKEQWATRLGPAERQGMRQGMEGPGCTPTVDGEMLYVVGAGGDVACLKVKDGGIVWQKNFVRDFGGRLPTWRFNESPLVDGDKVICTPGGPEAMLVALNKLPGDTVWKSQLPAAGEGGAGGAPGGPAGAPDGAPGGGPASPGGAPGGSGGAPGGPGGGRGGRGGRGFGGGGGSGAAYSSPIAIDFEGQRQYVQLTAKALIGVAASDGKLLWKYEKPANRMGINITTPLYHDGMIFAASAYGAGGGLVKLSKDAAGTIKAEEVYFTKDMQNHHGGVVVVDGAMYGANGGNEGGFLVCLDFKTGKVLWNERDSGQRRAPKGSVALADGRIYYRTEQGAMLLLEPNPSQFTERGRFEQPDRTPQPAWAHPVIANGKLYLRDQDALFCYDIKAK